MTNAQAHFTLSLVTQGVPLSSTAIDQFFADITRFPVLEHSEHIELAEIIQEWQQHPDGHYAAPKAVVVRGMWARDKMVRHNLRLVVFIWREKYAVRLPMSSPGLMDAFQSASLGLVRAAEKYQPSKAKFSTYALAWVHKGFREYLNTDRTVRIPFNNMAVLKTAQAHQADAERRGETPPDCEEIIERMKKTRKHVPTPDHLRRLLRQAHMTNPLSTDAFRSRRNGDNDDTIAERVFFLASDNRDEDLETLREMLPSLDPEEQQILKRRYLTEKPATLGELAKEMNTTRAVMSRREQELISTLKNLCA